jgi:hypothetical protein
VRVAADPRTSEVEVETANVAGLELDLSEVAIGGPVTLRLDGKEFSVARGRVLVARENGHGQWLEDRPVEKAGGPFKEVFGNRMVFVYGTGGTPEENAAILAQVRYDTETWWVRGNGSVPVLPDREFDPARFAGRNVILYGNRTTNSAYRTLLPSAPVRIERDRVLVGMRAYKDDLGLYLCHPRADGPGMVAVIGATTARATRMLQQARYFISGVVCPDWVVFSEDTLLRGMEGVAASGYFDNRWR